MMYGCIRASLVVGATALVAVSCANRGQGQQDSLIGGGTPGGGSSGGGAGGSDDGSTGFGGGGDGSNGIVIPEGGGAGDACQHFDVQALPRIPLVFVLVDRSGSMFTTINSPDGGASNEWDPLRAATLAVIQGLQSQVAFGFTAYTGINPNTTPGMCPILQPQPAMLPIALGNGSAIAAAYPPASAAQPTFKAETPAQKSLEVVGQTLQQATLAGDAGGGGQPGGKYILFVTDGETDFCDDGNPVCPADAVVAELEKLHGQGIQTLVLGVGSNQSNISVPVLQSFANAGAGVTPLAPPSSAQGMPLLPGDIYNQCNSVAGWSQLWSAAGLSAGQALGTYASAAPAQNATVYSPNATDVTDLTNQIAAALNTVKSCAFDLQGKIKVDLAHADKGKVSINGTPVPYDATNGWTMASATEIDLVGSACQTWRATGTDISFDFPCDVIIVLQ